jgi:Ca-activated chloride channel family protein
VFGDVSQARRPIFVLDTSGSMGCEQRLDMLKSVMGALFMGNEFESINVVKYSSSADSWASHLREATTESIADAQKWVNDLSPDGITNMVPAFEKVRTASRSADGTIAADCIYFLTDGVASDGEENVKDRALQVARELSDIVPAASAGQC